MDTRSTTTHQVTYQQSTDPEVIRFEAILRTVCLFHLAAATEPIPFATLATYAHTCCTALTLSPPSARLKDHLDRVLTALSREGLIFGVPSQGYRSAHVAPIPRRRPLLPADTVSQALATTCPSVPPVLAQLCHTLLPEFLTTSPAFRTLSVPQQTLIRTILGTLFGQLVSLLPPNAHTALSNPCHTPTATPWSRQDLVLTPFRIPLLRYLAVKASDIRTIQNDLGLGSQDLTATLAAMVRGGVVALVEHHVPKRGRPFRGETGTTRTPERRYTVTAIGHALLRQLDAPVLPPHQPDPADWMPLDAATAALAGCTMTPSTLKPLIAYLKQTCRGESYPNPELLTGHGFGNKLHLRKTPEMLARLDAYRRYKTAPPAKIEGVTCPVSPHRPMPHRPALQDPALSPPTHFTEIYGPLARHLNVAFPHPMSHRKVMSLLARRQRHQGPSLLGQYRLELANPTLSPHRLRVMAKERHPALDHAIATHPACPVDLRASLALTHRTTV